MSGPVTRRKVIRALGVGSLGAALIQALREAGEDPADLVEAE